MNCIKCKNKGVYKNGTTVFCKLHFLRYFENKVFRTIKRYSLINKNDKVCVAVSGGKDSTSALYLTMLYCRKRDINFFALAINEGIKDYRNYTLLDLKEFCDKYEIDLHIASFKDEFGFTLDEIKDRAINKLNKKPCNVCGIFRRTLLNRNAKYLNATKLVTGHNLDDEAQSFMMNTLLGNMRHNAGLGPITGINIHNKFVQRVKPLYFISERETRAYSYLKGFKIGFNECPNVRYSFRAVIRDHLNEIENKFPGIKNGVINSFLDVLYDLKNKYKNEEISYCRECGDPCANEICNACKLENELILKLKC